MSKKLDWESLSTPFGSRPLPGAPKQKYASGKERMLKAFADEEANRERMEFIAKAEPGMKAIFTYRLKNRLPIQVVRPLGFRTSELTKGENPRFVDTQKVIPEGTILMPVSIDPTMQEYIFKSQYGEEFAINFADERQIYMSTDIYEFVMKHLRGE